MDLKRYPKSHKKEGAAFLLNRIPAVPLAVRELLIDRYFAKEIRDKAKGNKANQACLMVEHLNLDEELLADELAIALAAIHWQAQVDAMDTEFVLGSAPPTPAGGRPVHVGAGQPHEVDNVDHTKRPIHVWVLDFDKSSSIELIHGDVDRLVVAFLGNDPYFPRPDVSIDLCIHFNETYLKASCLILENRHVDSQAIALPALFIAKVEAKITEHEGWNAEDDIVFGL